MDEGILGEFDDPHAMLNAVSRLREMGYRRLDAFSPHDVIGTDEALGLSRSRLPVVVLAFGLLGASLGYLFQWYPNAVSYPLDVGGRPAHALPAFVMITFEMGILGAALGAVVALLFVTGLPRLWHPAFEAREFERASVDRFFVGIGADDPRFDPRRSAEDLVRLGASRVVRAGGAV